MIFGLRLFLCATVLVARTALGQTSLPVLIQQLIGKTEKVNQYLWKHNLTASILSDSGESMTELLAQINPYIESLPWSAGDYLNSSENIDSVFKFMSLDEKIHSEFSSIVASSSSALNTPHDPIPTDDHLDALDSSLLHWNNMMVNVSLPFQRTLNLWSDSINSLPVSESVTFGLEKTIGDKRKYLLFSLSIAIDMSKLCEIQKTWSTLARVGATALLNSMHALAEEITRNCGDHYCRKNLRYSANRLKYKTKCYNGFQRHIMGFYYHFLKRN